METEVLQLGAVAVIFLFAIKEFFAWQKTRKTNGNSVAYEKDIAVIKTILDNHMVDYARRVEKIEKACEEMKIVLARIEERLKIKEDKTIDKHI